MAGQKLFMVVSTGRSVWRKSVVAQEKVIHDMFLPLVNQLNFLHAFMGDCALVGSQITFFAYPTGDMVGQMGLARSTDLKSMIKTGLITLFTCR